MIQNNIKNTNLMSVFFGGVFALALAMRLINLGTMPLNDFEASAALQALKISRGLEAEFDTQTAYLGLTGLPFFLFTASNFLARLFPALLGALVVFIPLLWRKFLGEYQALTLALILALSPEMVGLSRIIGSPMTAFVMLMLALSFYYHRKPIFTGITCAVGLMSGPGFWIGLLIFLCVSLVSRLLLESQKWIQLTPISNSRDFWLRVGIGFVSALVLIGTGFFLAPAGLSGVFVGLINFIEGFGNPGLALKVHFPLALVVYTAPAVVFGLWGSIRAVLVRSKPDLLLVIWWLVAFVILILYPAANPADLVWVTLPLWILSVRVLYLTLQIHQTGWFVIVATSLLVIVISAFMGISLRSLLAHGIEPKQQLNYFMALVGGIILLIAIILLVSYGWSEDIALSGLLIGLVILFSGGLLSNSIRSTGLNHKVSYELWFPEESLLSPKWMLATADQIVDWNASGGEAVEIVISGYETPGMEWAWRNYEPVNFVSYLPPQSQPGIIITDQAQFPELVIAYRGQDLIWSSKVLWREMTPYQYLQWAVMRKVPVMSDWVIVWVRTDLMPDSQF